MYVSRLKWEDLVYKVLSLLSGIFWNFLPRRPKCPNILYIRITRSRSDYVSWVMSPGQCVSWVGQIRQRLLSNWNQTMFWQLSSRNLWHHPSDQTRPSVTRVTKPDQASPEWPNQTKRLPSDQTRPSVTRVTKPDQASPKWPNQTKRHPSDQTR